MTDGETPKMITVPEERLEFLLNDIEEKKREIKQLYDASIKILELIGLANDGMVKSECFNGDENAMPHIIKGAGSLFSMLTKSQIPVIGKTYEAQLQEKFSFFAPLIPVFEKYGKEFYGK
jgi:hypothetical protein